MSKPGTVDHNVPPHCVERHSYCVPLIYTIVEVWRTEVAISHIKAKISAILDFSKTVAKMLFLSVSRESIGILTISRKTVFRSTPPSRGDRLILKSKMAKMVEKS